MTTRARARAWGLACGLGLGAACGEPPRETATGDADGPPPANARAMLDEARRDLANPERSPLRHGRELDQEALRQALLRLRAQHGAQVAVAYEASIEALPVGEPPAAERFEPVAAFVMPAEPAAREVEAVNWLFDADVHATAHRVLGTYLTLMMVHEVGMTHAEIGVWMAFLRAAKPELRRCGGAPAGPDLVLCVDYGDDVFVIDVEREGPAWVGTRLRWMQAQPAG